MILLIFAAFKACNKIIKTRSKALYYFDFITPLLFGISVFLFWHL